MPSTINLPRITTPDCVETGLAHRNLVTERREVTAKVYNYLDSSRPLTASSTRRTSPTLKRSGLCPSAISECLERRLPYRNKRRKSAPGIRNRTRNAISFRLTDRQSAHSNRPKLRGQRHWKSNPVFRLCKSPFMTAQLSRALWSTYLSQIRQPSSTRVSPNSAVLSPIWTVMVWT
jgi:hypothetical protein